MKTVIMSRSLGLVVYSHWKGPGPGAGSWTEPGSMGIMICKNVHAGLRQGQWPGPFVSYCANPVPCIAFGLGSMQCEQTIMLNVERSQNVRPGPSGVSIVSTLFCDLRLQGKQNVDVIFLLAYNSYWERIGSLCRGSQTELLQKLMVLSISVMRRYLVICNKQDITGKYPFTKLTASPQWLASGSCFCLFVVTLSVTVLLLPSHLLPYK